MVTEAIKPDDWIICNILENSTLKARIGWQGLTTAEYLERGDYHLVSGVDFKNGKIDWDKCFYVEKMRYDQDRNIQLKIGDVLVTKDGTIGKIAYVDKLPLPTTLNSGVFVIRPKNKDYNTQYVYYVFLSEFFKKFLNKLKAGSTISHLYQKDFASFDFILPPTIEEQKTVAQVLSDTDELINSLNKLIAKKEGLKKGAMQELLTGKKRLLGFNDDWKKELFGNLIDINKGEQINKSELTISGDYPDWNGGISPSGYTHKWNTDAYTITISEGGNSCGFVNYCKEKFWLGGHCYALKIKNANLLKMFLFPLLKFKEKSIMSLRIGSGLPNIQKKNLKEFELTIPLEIKEQQAIAQVLSDMDSDIDLLIEKRDKYLLFKQGMMQQLLTGKIRLV